MNTSNSGKIKTAFYLVLLTVGALLVHGYHPYAEDAEIYLPGVLKLLNPALFPTNTEFFGEHAGHTLYPNLIAASVRVSHLPLLWVAFAWQILSMFLLLAGTLRLASAFFEDNRARWAAVAFMGALFTLPLAGTALYIHDQYLNPRNLAASAAVFAIAELLHRKYLRTFLWLTFAAAMHPFMSGFAIMFCVWLLLIGKLRPHILGFSALLPFGITLAPPPAAYHQVAIRQPSHYIFRWEWYEWLGVIGPILLFWLLARWARRRGMAHVEWVSRAGIPFVSVAAIAAIVLSSSSRFEALARLQPLRCLALAYMLLIVIGGGWIGLRVLQGEAWRWLVLFLPLCTGMWYAQRQLFPASAHIEWPWAQPRNPWAQAFDWIRDNTPTDAMFALDPNFMALPGEDEMGFRARAQRGRLADFTKDKGASTMFPPMAVQWLEQVQDQRDWQHFNTADLERLHQKYGVTWVLVEQPAKAGLECPYENSTVSVCRLDSTHFQGSGGDTMP